QPQDGPRARVRFVANNQYATHVRQEADDCASTKTIAHLGRLAVIATNPGKLGMPSSPDVPDNTIAEIYVPAGKPFNFSMSFGIGGVYTAGVICAVTTVFEPRANADYEVTFGAGGNNTCKTEVLRIAGAGPYTRVPEETARKSATQC